MLTPWYVTGFCEGGAAFTYSRTGSTLGLYFAIKQQAENRQLIEEIQEYFNYVGDIYQRADPNLGKSSNTAKSPVYYRVTKIQELQRIIQHFDKYPLQDKTKQEIYDIWREMALHKLENYRNIDFEKLRTLAARLSGLHTQSRALKKQKK